jgi:uncharacterized protein YidB (DUF937 family)
MGLLDDLLGQPAGGAGAGQSGSSLGSEGRASSGGFGQIAAALLPVVMAMLSSRSGASRSVAARAGAGTGGGLGDILGQVLGGGSGASGQGGLGDLLDQFQRAGFGDQARSWVGTGQNLPISPDALTQVLGRSGIAEIARRAGLSERETSDGLSQLLPEVVDRVTPRGEVPAEDDLVASVDSLTRRLGLA